jgi:cobalt-zinc-cadmium efflux system membrane fusion protein
MNRNILSIALIAVVVGAGAWVIWGGGPAEDAHDDHWQESAAAPHAEITAERAAKAGIEMETAGPAVIRETVTLLGRLSLDPARTAQVRARFPGVVREARKSQGDAVNSGDVLVLVESNDSLQTYVVRAPLAGTVLSRTVSPGEVTGTDALFEIGDLKSLRADLHAFPNDLPRLSTGQPVRLFVQGGGDAVAASIATLVPVVESATQAVIARADVDNADGRLRPGAMVRGEVQVGAREAPVTVLATALQQFRGQTAVFVRAGEKLEARTVTVGAQDGERAEIIAGLAANAPYVARGSFLVKSEIEKSTSEHSH